MKSRRHSTDLRCRVEDGVNNLVCDTYDKYKNDGSQSSQDIIPLTSKINFIYIND